MPFCPFAKWMPITGPVGDYNGGPFKIVHHTTEGSSAAGAFSAYRTNRSDPHFTVDATTIYQHVDTDKAARSLRNAVGGVETNRNRAIQIEVVGVAAVPKGRATLENVALLCRWLEAQHGIQREWPGGPPKPAKNGRDPGGHNRDPATWTTRGGHYGHSQVPENTHWDPGYTADEARFILEADPTADAELDDSAFQARYPTIPLDEPVLTDVDISMHDHSVTEVEEPVEAHAPADGDVADSFRRVVLALTGAAEAGPPGLLFPQGVTEILLSLPSGASLTVRGPGHGALLGHTAAPADAEAETPCEAPHDHEDIDPTADATRVEPVDSQLAASTPVLYAYGSSAKRFGRASTIRAMQEVAAAYSSATRVRLGIGNISLRGGGPMPPHVSHRNGLDVDVRVPRQDTLEAGTTWRDAGYSRARTQTLVNIIRANGVLRVRTVLFNDPHITGVSAFKGHDDHLHISFLPG